MSVHFVPRTGRSRVITLLVSLIAIAAMVLTNPLSAHSDPRDQARTPQSDEPSAPPLPPGVNNWLCKPSPKHPEPVVLLHGLFATAELNWPYFAPELDKAGYCVFAPTYGTSNGEQPLPAMARMEESAKELKRYVDRVKLATGAKKVDLIGHSAGGLMPRQYLRFEGGAAHVDDFVALGPPNHGTTFKSAFEMLPQWVSDAICPSCLQYSDGSEFLAQLNKDHEVEPGVSYTTISSKLDELILPYTSARLQGDSGQVTNITVQDKCPMSVIDHYGLALDAVPLQWAVNALDRPGPADPAFTPTC
ncbi:alpha/beta fold hydrolase [Streptomyces sp. HC44]|uniref:Alpha/beta fold hydrolase n=1 Tax=Streptomyces scabichelini TaxID=2711217 RepID=A0A6G4VCR0_9ACTN|nr:alpha/beta fold hydrolase [Streptomyces scabichelini]NGO11584.1 alpha/beta fold hydrolase [Streptomyces scabichelini]